MLTTALILLLGGAMFALCMGALSLQRALGWGPLMLLMGALEALKIFVLTPALVDWPGVGAVRLGSILSYMNALTVVQVVYLRGGLGAARQLVWALVGTCAVLSVLGALIAALLTQPEAQQPLRIDLSVLSSGARVEVIGDVLLLLGLSACVFLVNAFQRWGWGVWWSLLLTLLVVSGIDTVLFIGAAFGPSAFVPEAVLPALKGKAWMALWFASLAKLALLLLRKASSEGTSGLPDRVILAALSFRRKLGQVEEDLLRDPLTEVYNRRYLEQVVPGLLHLDHMRKLPTSLIMVHVESVSPANEAHGRAVGDRMLAHAARCMMLSVRRSDVVLRDHGSTFVLVLPATAPSHARQAAEQVLERLRSQPLMLVRGDQIPLQACAGLAVAPEDGDVLGSLMHAARERLALAVRQGAGQVVDSLG